MHAEFISWIHEKRLIEVSFVKSDGTATERRCAPIDYGPFKNLSGDRYHLIDLSKKDKPHIMGLSASQIVSVMPSNDQFDPLQLVTWTPSWHISRDW